MLRRVKSSRAQWLTLTVLTLALLVPRWSAAQSVVESSSLRFVPANAAFYGTMMRGREQVEAFLNSNAFAKLKSMQVVQMGMAQLQEQMGEQLAMAEAALQSPQAQMGLAMLADAFSNEVFVYGDEGFGDMVAGMTQMQAIMNQAQLEAAGSGRGNDEAMLDAMLKMLEKMPAGAKMPDMVMGFKMTNTEPLKEMMDQLEGMAQFFSQQQPMLQGRINRKQVGGGDFLVATVDGEMIPWPMLQSDFPGSDAQFNTLVNKIKPLTMALAVGVMGDYMVISIGDADDHLSTLGQGSLLADRDELKPLQAHANERITGISYTSQAFAQAAGSVDSQMANMVNTVKQALTMSDLPSSIQDELVGDMKYLANMVSEAVPEPGAAMSYSFMNDTGYESFRYNWGEMPLDGSKPLTLLNHVGGDPLLYAVGRGVYNPKQVDQLMYVLKRGIHYAEVFGTMEMDDEDRQLVAKLKQEFAPVAERMEKVTRDKLIPAFKDGQGGLVVDAKTTSKAWHAFMPSPNALPMIEVGLIYGVSDAAAVKEAFSEYFEMTQEVLTKLHDLSTGELADAFPNELPEVTLEPPMTKDVGGGTIYYYNLPAASGIDQQLAPNAGLSDEVMVMSLVPKFTARLMTETSLGVGAEAARQGKPIAAASYCNFPGLIDAVMPWVDFGSSMAFQVNQPDPQQLQMIMSTIKDVAEVLKCFQGGSSVTYKENGAWVTHSQSMFKDLP